MIKTIAELKALNAENGYFFFSKQTMNFFKSKVHGGIIRGQYFITSECNFDKTKRLFTIREFDQKANIKTVGEFQAYKTYQDAKNAIKEGLL